MAKKQIATFLGPQPGISILGNHAYGFSGSIQNAGSGSASTTLLNFQSAKHYIVSTIDFTTTLSSAHDLYFDIALNGIIVSNTKEASTALIPMRFNILIPPLTQVVVRWGAGTTADGSVVLVGRVYE